MFVHNTFVLIYITWNLYKHTLKYSVWFLKHISAQQNSKQCILDCLYW